MIMKIDGGRHEEKMEWQNWIRLLGSWEDQRPKPWQAASQECVESSLPKKNLCTPASAHAYMRDTSSCTHKYTNLSVHPAPSSFIKACWCYDEHSTASPFPPEPPNFKWMTFETNRNADCKITSIASIVKRPSRDESQPKGVQLPGRAALLFLRL